VAGTLVASILLLAPLVARPAGDLPGGSSPRPETRLVGVVNVNTATPDQLELLPGVGPARARAIVEYRKTHGAFKQIDDLVEVSGIGPVALERIRRHCAVQGKTTARLEP
jgi:competence protein ComEA